MKNFAWILIGIVAALAGVLLLLPEPSRQTPDSASTPERTFIRGARVFDGEEFIDEATLVIAEGRVEALGRDLGVDGNQLADIEATANIDAIWKNGRPVDFPAPATPESAGGEPVSAQDPLDLLDDTGRWRAAADDYMGGASSAEMAWAGGASETALKVTGHVAPGHAFPYAGAMWFASEIPMQTADYAGYRRMVVEIDGPDRQYQALLFSGDSQASPPARVALEIATENTIELDSIAGLELKRLRAIGVFAGGSPGPVDFTVRALRLE